MDQETYLTKEKLSVRIIHFIEDIWPSIYSVINSIFFGILRFIKDLVITAFRGWG